MPAIGDVSVFYWVDIDIVYIMPMKDEKYLYFDIVLYILHIIKLYYYIISYIIIMLYNILYIIYHILCYILWIMYIIFLICRVSLGPSGPGCGGM